MAATAVGDHLSERLSQIVAEPLAIVPAITSILQSLNPQNPRTHQNPDPSILNRFSPCLNPDLVIQTVNIQTSPYHSLFFFNWASNPNPNPNNYSHTHFCYIAITDKLFSCKLFSLAADLLKSHERFSDFMVGKFIKVHGDLGHLRWAIKLFHEVKQREHGFCLFSFNAILGVLVKANRVDLALAYFGQSIKEGAMRPDVSTFTTLINGLCKVGSVEDAEKVFDKMEYERNLVTYNTIIRGFCKKGLVEKARKVLDELLQSESFSPDVVTFTCLIDGYCKNGDLETAIKCFEEMGMRENCKPNLVTYNALINGLCSSGNVSEARRLMSLMRLSGVKDNIATRTSLLKGYCIAGRSNEAIEYFKEMDSLGIELDGKSYAVVVNEYCKLRRPDEAILLLRKMRARGINPSVASFNAIFRSLIELKELDKALLLLKDMPQLGCYPNFLSYSAVVIGLIKSEGRMQEAEMLVNDMHQKGHRLDATLYSCLVKGYIESGDINKAIGFLKEMVDERYVINIECFTVFVKELIAKGMESEINNLFRQMVSRCMRIDVTRYQSVLDEFIVRSEYH